MDADAMVVEAKEGGAWTASAMRAAAVKATAAMEAVVSSEDPMAMATKAVAAKEGMTAGAVGEAASRAVCRA